jgi:hypothetical protein
MSKTDTRKPGGGGGGGGMNSGTHEGLAVPSSDKTSVALFI